MAFLNISSKNKKGILNDIDKQNYFCLASPTSRLDLYNFMLALGYNNGLPTELESAKESLIREEYVNNQRFIYSAVYFTAHESGCIENIEEITNVDKIFLLMDKYANTGFSVITDYMRDLGEMALAYKLIPEMDEMYEQFLQDQVENQ